MGANVRELVGRLRRAFARRLERVARLTGRYVRRSGVGVCAHSSSAGAREASLDCSPVVVYSMGKVGSNTLVEMLRASECMRDVQIHHTHGLTAEFWKRMRSYIPAGRHSFTSEAWLRVVDDLEEEALSLSAALDLARMRIASGHSPKWKVVTGCREPIGWLLSSFFQLIGPETLRDELGIPLGSPDAANRISKFFWRQAEVFLAGGRSELGLDLVSRFVLGGFEHCHQWFDMELKRTIDFDVYSKPFDQENQCARGETPVADVLVIRFEGGFQKIDSVLASFVGSDKPFVIRHKNSGDDKPLAALYRQVREETKFPRELCEYSYSSQYSHHFYSRAEREALIARWAG